MQHQAITLGEGEHVITTVRRHWYHLALEGVAFAFVMLVLAFGTGMAQSYVHATYPERFIDTVALGTFVLAFVGLLVWMRFFAVWSDHWLDAWIITNKRIIDIEQHGFFRRQVSSFPLDRIQDVTYEVRGIIAMWLHFGDVRIQTASITSDLVLRQVPFPDLVKEEIASLLNRHN